MLLQLPWCSIAGCHITRASVSLFQVTDAIVLMDREQGGVAMLGSEGIKLHPVISMSQLLSVLQAAGRISPAMAQSVRDFILDNNTFRYTAQHVGTRSASELLLLQLIVLEGEIIGLGSSIAT